MTKQQTIDFLETQLLVTSGFYSTEQVIEMISKIEEEKPAQTMSRAMAMKIIKVAQEAVASGMQNIEWSDYPYDLELNGNEITLTSIDVDSDSVENEVESDLAAFFEEEFDIEI
jgi:hypothetical protein